MKNFSNYSFLFLLLGLFSFGPLSGQVEYIVCNSKFKVYCDGTVDVDLSNDVTRYKVFISGIPDAILDFQGSQVNVEPFNTGDFTMPNGDKVIVTPAQNFFVEIYRPGCIEYFPISFYMSQTCPPPTQVKCGSTFSARCNGTFDIDLAENVTRYKVFQAGIPDAIFDFQGSQINYAPFNTGDFFNPITQQNVIIQPSDNFYVELYAPGCNEIFNLSSELYQYCSDYNPCYGLTGDNGNNYTYGYAGTGNFANLELDALIEIPVGKEEGGIAVYPNPTDDRLNISLPFTENRYDIQMFDLSGKAVKNIRSNGGDFGIEVQDLTSGLYLLKVQGEGLNYLEKIQVIR